MLPDKTAHKFCVGACECAFKFLGGAVSVAASTAFGVNEAGVADIRRAEARNFAPEEEDGALLRIARPAGPLRRPRDAERQDEAAAWGELSIQRSCGAVTAKFT